MFFCLEYSDFSHHVTGAPTTIRLDDPVAEEICKALKARHIRSVDLETKNGRAWITSEGLVVTKQAGTLRIPMDWMLKTRMLRTKDNLLLVNAIAYEKALEALTPPHINVVHLACWNVKGGREETILIAEETTHGGQPVREC